jgi:poly(3-hydroxybutyrate) depolymerase
MTHSFPTAAGSPSSSCYACQGASTSVADAMPFWTRRNGCVGAPIFPSADQQGVSVISYPQCGTVTAVEAWTLDHLGHDWPSLLARLSDPEHRALLDAILGAAMTVFVRKTALSELRGRVTVEYSAEVDARTRCRAH